MNDIQDIHELSLVFVDSLNLDIVKSIERHIITGLVFDPLSQFFLVSSFDLDELIDEILIISEWNKLLQVVKRSDPFINSSKSFTQKIRQLRVATMDPSSWSYSICLVLKLTRVKFVEFLENSLFEELRMKSSYSIYML
jgi:hypothetical protein